MDKANDVTTARIHILFVLALMVVRQPVNLAGNEWIQNNLWLVPIFFEQISVFADIMHV